MSETTGAPVRSGETKRLDNFIDAAFAFAVSLLIIAGGQPLRGFADLLDALARIPAFAGGFALVVLFWLGHRNFGRVVPGRGTASTMISLMIVFAVLIWVFPARLLTETAFHFMSGGVLPGRGLITSLGDLRGVYVIYGLGFALLAGLYWLLYQEALAREDSGIAPEDRGHVRDWRTSWAITAGVGLVSAGEALLLPIQHMPWLPGVSYMLIPALIGLANWLAARRARERAAPPQG